MCGFAGFLTPSPAPAATLAAHAERMAGTLVHRGPDDAGCWTDADAGVALAFRRLAIVDLSVEGHQPMRSADGRYVIVFNGEIYNHRALRSELEQACAAPPWRGHSDTEVLLAAILHWGLAGALERAVGMFAIALWDRRDRVLSLARDRAGEKPLYYGFAGADFVFASELKALRMHPAWAGEIDRDALALYLERGWVPAPRSIYRGIRKMLPGTILAIDARALASRTAPEPVPYWSVADAFARARSASPIADEVEAIDALERALGEAIDGQRVADVPLGAFLSGGIDSSTIVALMQQRASEPVRTFTIGFADERYDEAAHARAVAAHLGTRHTEVYVSAQQALETIGRLADVYDEPFGDSSQIPTLLVAELARAHVTVALSGDGGDELFGGYNWYRLGADLERRVGWLPGLVRRIAGRAVCAVPTGTWDAWIGAAGALAPRALRVPMVGDKLHKAAALARLEGEARRHLHLIAPWAGHQAVVGGRAGGTDPVVPGADVVERMMARDMLGYLPDDILVKVDRAAMSVSLETRVPLLDHRVIELAWRLAPSLRWRDGVSKWVLRQVLYRHVPRELVERPKQGFSVPLDAWLRGPLREWAQSMLAPDRLAREGFLDPHMVETIWDEHQASARNWQHRLWNVLMFQAWLERNGR